MRGDKHETKIVWYFYFVGFGGITLSHAADTTSTNVKSPELPDTYFMAIVVFLGLFAGIPLILNMYMSHKHIEKMHETLAVFINKQSDKVDKDVCKIDTDALLQVIKEIIDADPSGASGLIRGTMALTITLVVGIALFFLVKYQPNDPSPIKDVLLTLTGALTSIIGFYFGGKAGEAAHPTNVQPTTKPPENKPPENKSPENKPPATTQPKAGWYNIKIDFSDGDDHYYAGNYENLSAVPADKLAVWIKNKFIEP
jgi:hypothetical protein